MKLLPLLCLLSAGFGPASAGETCNSAVPGVPVAEGEDALLCCDFGQKVVGFHWKKDNGKEENTVFFYDNGIVRDPIDQFSGRVEFFKDELDSGNASIKIRDTRLEDSGTYTCVLVDPGRQEINIRLNVVGVLKKRENVAGAARKPYIDVQDNDTWSLLECEAQGVPEPELEWRNSAGDILNKTKKYAPKNQKGPFHVKLRLNVSRSDTYTCVVKQESIYHQISRTTKVSIPEREDFMPVSGGRDAVLPCHLHSKENIENMKFSWSKDHHRVFLYDRSAVEERGQFRGRVTYFQHELKFGNASIKIHKTQTSDSGRYTCHFADHQKSHVILHVEGSATDLGPLCRWIVTGILGVILLS